MRPKQTDISRDIQASSVARITTSIEDPLVLATEIYTLLTRLYSTEENREEKGKKISEDNKRKTYEEKLKPVLASISLAKRERNGNICVLVTKNGEDTVLYEVQRKSEDPNHFLVKYAMSERLPDIIFKELLQKIGIVTYPRVLQNGQEAIIRLGRYLQ